MIELTWAQVNMWRLARHYLLEQAPNRQWLRVVSQICGLHAQLLTAAELALAARVHGVKPGRLDRALWQSKSLVKTWAMRGTLHLLPATDFHFYAAAARTRDNFRKGAWHRYFKVSPSELEAILAAVPAVLGSRRLTREALAEAVAKHSGSPRLKAILLSSWGAVLKPAAYQGSLCFGPNEGANITFVRPDRWQGKLERPDPSQSLQEVYRRYLHAYGPATLVDFARWWGMQPAPARRVIQSVSGDLVEVSVEGWKAWALAGQARRIKALKPTASVRLLPHFDPYTVAAYRHSQFLLAPAFKGRVYRPQGWIAPVVLVDGRMEGVWDHEKKRGRTILTVEMFKPPASKHKRAIAAEADRLAEFWSSEVEVVYGRAKGGGASETAE